MITAKRVVLVCAAAFLAAVAALIWVRATAPGRALVVETLEPRPPPDRGFIRIVAYNIAHGRGPGDSNFDGGDREERALRMRELGSFIQRQDADVVVLNEVDFDALWSHGVDYARELASIAQMPYLAKQANLDTGLPLLRFRFGNAILSRHPLTDCERIEYPPVSAWEALAAGSKQGGICTVSAPRPFRLASIHLEHRSEPSRVAQAQVIVRAIEESKLPVVLAGDFNSTPGTGESALDLLLATQRFAHRDAGFTFSSTKPEQTIDWILVPKEWSFAEYRVAPSILSDHFALVADVITPPDTAPR